MLKQVFEKAISLNREFNGQGELNFVAYLVSTLGLPSDCDAIGNMYYKVGESDTLFTAHLDTITLNREPVVENKFTSQMEDGRLIYRAVKGSTLGADDGAGCAILACMILAGKPGTYVFFQGEEKGGIGSTHAAEHRADYFNQFKRAVAFDRRGTSDVIYTQGGETASYEFAAALALQMASDGYLFMPEYGTYTDTRELAHLIPECTNISSGYADEHSDRESQDFTYLEWLLAKSIALDWDALPTLRTPEDPYVSRGSGWMARDYTDGDWASGYEDDINEVEEFQDQYDTRLPVVAIPAHVRAGCTDVPKKNFVNVYNEVFQIAAWDEQASQTFWSHVPELCAEDKLELVKAALVWMEDYRNRPALNMAGVKNYVSDLIDRMLTETAAIMNGED